MNYDKEKLKDYHAELSDRLQDLETELKSKYGNKLLRALNPLKERQYLEDYEYYSRRIKEELELKYNI